MKKAIIALAGMALVPASAIASDFNYNYIDASIAFTEHDLNLDATNYNFEYRGDLDASAVADTPDSVGTFWRAGINHISFDDVDASYTGLFGDIGAYTAVTPVLDLGGYAGLTYATAESGPVDDSEIGLRLGGFMRFAATDALDIEGGVTHNTAFDGYSDIYGRAMFDINENVRLGGGLRLGDSGDGFEFRFRYGF